MKTFCLVLLLTITIYPQWQTDPIETDINVANAISYDIFTNRYGSHIIVHNAYSLYYYKIDTEGDIITSYTLEDIPPRQGTDLITPSICGNENNIYVVYRIAGTNNIRIKYSTDGGDTWNLHPAVNPAAVANSIESIVSENKLHITYERNGRIYHNYMTIGEDWIGESRVSPDNHNNCTRPRIDAWNAGSEDKVYFYYYDDGVIRWRERNIATGAPPTNELWFIASGGGAMDVGFAVDDTYIYGFFKLGGVLVWTPRLKSDNVAYPFGGNSNGNTVVTKIYSTTTAANKSYTAAWSTLNEFPNSIVRMGFQHTHELLYAVIHTESGLQPVPIVNLSSAGNDVHVIWKDNFSSNKLRYKYDDQAPTALTNLTVTKSQNNHPLLQWNPGLEPDIDQYVIYKSTGGWHSIYQTSSTSYEDTTESYCTLPPPQQCDGGHDVSYYVKVMDLGSHLSSASNTVTTHVLGDPPDKIVVNPDSNEPIKYCLDQNYPNPFNPTTKITYALSEDAKVQIKVYDMLGTEVAELINETKPAGFYDATFDASNLSSGVYIYRITALNGDRILFSQSKQMILLK